MEIGLNQHRLILYPSVKDKGGACCCGCVTTSKKPVQFGYVCTSKKTKLGWTGLQPKAMKSEAIIQCTQNSSKMYS
jgi:hypothetical protein